MEVNKEDPLRDINAPFRMQKVNLVWQKALKRLTASQQEDLYVDLKIQDKLEMETKKKVTSGLDENGEQEAYTRDKLREILIRHGLHDHFGDADENETWLKNKYGETDSHMTKMDRKIAKLWKKAQASGFTDEEMGKLKTELLHHQQKMDEYNQLKNEIGAADGINDNSIDGLKKLNLDLNDRKGKNKELKTKYKELKEDLKRLERISSVPSESYNFTEAKVIDLWILAKKANFSDEELESLKVELAHFEHKIKKHNHYVEEVRQIQDNFRQKGKSNVHPHTQEKLETKLEEYGRKVEKYHREIKKRISKSLRVDGEL